MSKTDRDNRANQLNPNNDAYWQSRGFEEKPEIDEDQYGSESDPQSKRA